MIGTIDFWKMFYQLSLHESKWLIQNDIPHYLKTTFNYGVEKSGITIYTKLSKSKVCNLGVGIIGKFDSIVC